ncbi:archease [Candidatus Woesearchaeota archaeon]|jgi:SHS2 domain-containing protein|nr:archease [Candidatus Woesearchaeota archaeon]MBT4322184.1 archease [Candidatus Woesearchaeota archaeon]MBT4631204.1 archease [Candidatus Woesearchaeota archaeon]
MKYKYLEHTADAKFQAFGSGIDEVFTNSALAMFNILGKTSEVKIKKTYKIKLKARNYERLLLDFLEELLFLLDTEDFFLHEVIKIKISKKFELEAVVVGDDYKNYDLKSDIKAVTYSDMKIEKTKKGYAATVVVDI